MVFNIHNRDALYYLLVFFEPIFERLFLDAVRRSSPRNAIFHGETVIEARPTILRNVK